MGKNPDNWFKFYPDPYIDDTRHLSEMARFVYGEAIIWMRKLDGPLPDDMRWMVCAFHSDRKKVRRGLDELIADGKLVRSPAGIINPKCMADIAARQHQREVNTKTARTRATNRHCADAAQIVRGSCEVAARPQDGPSGGKTINDIREASDISLNETCSTRARNESQKVDSEDITPRPPEGGVRAKSKSKRKSRAKPKADPLHVQQAYERYCEFARDNGKTVPRRLPNLERKIAARLVEFGLDGWMKAIGNIELSRLLMGDRPFSDGSFCVVTIGMITRPENFAKLHDGGYGNDRKPRPKPSTVTFEPAQWRRGISKLIEERRNWDALSPPTPPPHSPGYCVPREIHDELDVGAHFATDGSGHFVAKQSRMPLPAPPVPQGRVSGQPALHAPEVR